MANPTPSADSIDGYDLEYLTELAEEEGIELGRKRAPQLRKELKVLHAEREKEEAKVKKTGTTSKASASKVVKKPKKASGKSPAKKAAKKPRTKSAGETEPEAETEPLDPASNAYRKLYYILQHFRTTRSELINEDQGDLL
ncbi:hypothetical protein Slin15195_G022440 [Septoria linicola]|uniref:Uncharacterized protein n=1 Tax=Septoria linicola TaxID=215465 RepID=A0A9Q9AM15_9PEZI|nr:hypothetical protein Slin15195_G022440 [Septoria linicola]